MDPTAIPKYNLVLQLNPFITERSVQPKTQVITGIRYVLKMFLFRQNIRHTKY
jgi:hypothetical protein